MIGGYCIQFMDALVIGRKPALIISIIILSPGSSPRVTQPARQLSPPLFQQQIETIVATFAIEQRTVQGIGGIDDVKDIARIFYLMFQRLEIDFRTQAVFFVEKPELALQRGIIGILGPAQTIGRKPKLGWQSGRGEPCLEQILAMNAHMQAQLTLGCKIPKEFEVR